MIAFTSLIAIPLFFVAVDVFGALRAKGHHREFTHLPNQDFTILVPIYGNISYLENVDYLASYGDRVMLLTTAGETDEFMAAATDIVETHGFRLFVAEWSSEQDPTRRATSGTIRDRLIRDALHAVDTEYVVPLDADSTTREEIGVAVGQVAGESADIASVRLRLSNADDNWITQLQQFEYRIAMEIRTIAPWLVSGACQVSRTKALIAIMDNHSLFFQGNDVEIGLLAMRLHMKVIHLPFEIMTAAPSTPRAWLRQRLAWAGGEFRLFIVNAWYVRWHPFFWIYGGVVVILAYPLRLQAVSDGSPSLVAVFAMYGAFVLFIHWRYRNVWLLLVLPYSLLNSLVFVPLGVLWYFKMAWSDRNIGFIRPARTAIGPASRLVSR